ncbi:type II and III secretion system protein family protein [Novosphingobium flavum]|uniref:Type II and III secretion system protein family protein n=2 Tax=Novosphingobium flavum TaxID=1778672 RepID=A0A7X1KJW9_9SPHN|nr:type II and III secretion system protein family protein [Novosphingobium flavum]MBC2663926.1 type II and III secretion system protein family protein [Novosphingobium flavum]
MTSRFTSSLLGAAAALAIPATAMIAAPAAAQTVTRPAQDIALSIGRGQLITVPGRMADVFVANDSVADVQIKSTNQLYLMGKAGGVTTVYASDGQGNVIWSANVRVGTNIDSVDQMLRVAMPEARIAVSTIGSDTVLLTGTIAAPEDAAEAQRLVQAFMGKQTNVITRLKMATPLQVNLQVRIAEVSRTLSKSLASNIATADGTGGFKFGIGQGTGPTQWTPGGLMGVNVTTGSAGTTVVPSITTGTTLAGAGKLFGLDILGTLDAGETAGLVTTLAQPNLTAISGETADFLAGGEYPYTSSSGINGATVEFKKYGVSLSYTPTVLANGRISLRVRPEVSELGASVIQNGNSVPTITTRRAETTVELGSGQSFMIAGLLRNQTTNSVQKLPGAGDIPILGALFRSTGFQRGETELVIVVTPYLVKPVDANAIKLPTDGYQAPDDVQRIFGNQQSAGKSGADRPKPSAAAPTQSNNPPAPKVGEADAAAPALAAGSELPARKGKADTSAQPGFSLK